jgi:alkylation response protein AidB-like acyl-CoA dehydrogenase
MSTPAPSEDGPLAASRKAFASATGSRVLEALGWWDLLAEPSDAEMRAAVFALFRAQGLALGDTCALGGLLARPYLPDDFTDGTVVAAIRRRSARRGEIDVVVGDVSADHLLIDSPGAGARVIPRSEVTLRPIGVAGRLTFHEVEVGTASRPTIPEDVARAARVRSRFLGRLGAAFEILGAAEAALALAVEHANVRVQFGDPIAKFQAVRHLLAWARTDCAAIEAVALAARDLDASAPARFDEIAKAIAGRNGRRACERALQVLGAIGFTAEHEHHHFHGRVLALDAILGSSAELSHGLGAWLRETRQVPDIPRALLVPAP